MVSALVAGVRQELLQDAALGENLLDALVVEQLAAQPRAVRLDLVSPFVVTRVVVQVRRQDDPRDARRFPYLLAGEDRFLRPDVVLRAKGGAIACEVPTEFVGSGKEAPFEDVMDREVVTGATDHAGMSVTGEAPLPELGPRL